jgi:hypothetical protein
MNSDINLNKITTDLQQNNNWNVMTLVTLLIKEGRDFAL